MSELQSEVHRLRSSAQTYLRDEREVRRDAGFSVFKQPAGSHYMAGWLSLQTLLSEQASQRTVLAGAGGWACMAFSGPGGVGGEAYRPFGVLQRVRTARFDRLYVRTVC